MNAPLFLWHPALWQILVRQSIQKQWLPVCTLANNQPCRLDTPNKKRPRCEPWPTKSHSQGPGSLQVSGRVQSWRPAFPEIGWMSGQIHFKSFEKLGTKERFEKEIAQATACSPKPSVPAVCTTYHASARKGAVEQGNFTPPNHVLTCSNYPFWRFPSLSIFQWVSQDLPSIKTAPKLLPVHLSIHCVPPSPTAAGWSPAESPTASANGAEDGALCLRKIERSLLLHMGKLSYGCVWK